MKSFFLLLLGSLALSGCGTIPDLQPFATSTNQVASALRASGKVVVADARTLVAAYQQDATKVRNEADGADTSEERKMRETEAARIDESATRLKQRTDELERHWNSNIKMAEALVDYSDSLAAIAAAGKRGQASADAVAKSLTRFLSAFDAAIPAAGAIAEVAPITSKLVGQIAAARAAKSLEAAVVATQPAIDEAARVLNANLAHLGRINHMLFLELPAILQDTTRAGFDVRAERRTLRVAMAAHDRLQREMAQAIEQNTDSAAREQALQALVARARQLETVIASSRAKLAPVDEKIAAERTRGAAQTRFIASAQSAVEEWAAYHRRLGTALAEKRVPSAEALVATAADVRELLNLLRRQS